MLRIADFAVTVTDAKATALWWEQKLGFETHTVGAPGGHALMVAPPGERFLIHLCEGFEAVEPGNTGIGFVTDEIERVTRTMEAAGVRFVEPFDRASGSGTAKFSDPDGNIFWLIGVPGPFIRRETARRAGAATKSRKTSRRK
jgi:catechol 2,3-dioxygenase-like lactoylglutathione lyase family enzyme